MPLPPIIPVKPRRHRKRRAAPLPSAAPPAGVTVVSVTTVDGEPTQALWTFSSAVVDVNDANWLLVANQEVDVVIIITAEGGLICAYSSGASAGDPWEAAVGTSLIFENGQELILPESGVVGG